MSDGQFFIRVRDSAEAREIAKKPHALALLWLIALRAHRGSETNIHGLKFGQAFVGDLAACGMTEQQYRTAKDMLRRAGLATFRGTNKGTVATLLGGSIFDVSFAPFSRQSNEQATSKQRAGNDPATTNREEEGDPEGERARAGSLPESSPSTISGPSEDSDSIAPEARAKWRPAFDALKATGKLPQLRIAHLVHADRAHPLADLSSPATFSEIAADACGMLEPIGDAGAWLRKKASRIESRGSGAVTSEIVGVRPRQSVAARDSSGDWSDDPARRAERRFQQEQQRLAEMAERAAPEPLG